MGKFDNDTLHYEAAKALRKVELKKSSVKTAVLSGGYKNKKQLYAVVCETLRYRQLLDHVVAQTDLMKKEKKALSSKSLAVVLLYDYLIGGGFHKAPNFYKSAILRNKQAIRTVVAREKARKGVTKIQDLRPKSVEEQVKIPRYARVNTLRVTVQDVCRRFKKEGYAQIPAGDMQYEEYIQLIDGLEKKEFVMDPHVKNLLVFAQGTDFHDHQLYVNGDIILQDKASCIPVHVLEPTPGSDVIDCCAAPGNKTSQAAAEIQNKGNVFAFDLDPKRLKVMNGVLSKAGASSVKTCHADILTVVPDDPTYQHVKYIIVDPSCSGSGIVSRLCELTDSKKPVSKKRLAGLAGFQEKVLLHALSFPSVERVVYSTCSVHHEENEQVVCKVLEQVHSDYHLVDILPEITSRGDNRYFTEASKCLRLGLLQDRTNGFFVACFERGGSEGPPARGPAMPRVDVGGSPARGPAMPCGDSPVDAEVNSNGAETSEVENSGSENGIEEEKIAQSDNPTSGSEDEEMFIENTAEDSGNRTGKNGGQKRTSVANALAQFKKKRKTSSNLPSNSGTNLGRKKKRKLKSKIGNLDKSTLDNSADSTVLSMDVSTSANHTVLQSVSQKKKKRKNSKRKTPVTL